MKLHSFLISWFVITLYCTPLAHAQQSSTPHILTLFFKPALKQYCEDSACDLLEHMHIPGYLNRTMLNQSLMAQIVSGIYVAHNGLVDHSDFNGQVSFPLITTEDHFMIVVTDAVKPVILYSNTVDHLERAEDTPAAFYTVTRTQKDVHEQPTWTIQQIDYQEQTIPHDALIIFSQPEHIIVASGTFHADASPNAVLPHIYVNDTTPLSTNALQFVKIAKFFAPVQRAYGYAQDRYANIIAN